MSSIDWIILCVTLAGIVLYGIYKSRTSKNLEGYFLSNRSLPWYLVLFSIMGTQASAITFLTGPGQAFSDGMRFVQYYFGLPLAMIVISIFFVPVFSRLKVYTAYEFLENRFDLKTRTLTSFLFLLSRGLSTGISIFAPSIVLSSLMGWNIYYTNLVMGGILIIYTMSGGAKAVAHTQKLQMIIVFVTLFIVGYLAVKLLPDAIGFTEALHKSGEMGKMNIITTGFTDKGFDWKDRYNIWSGLIGGFFLALSYFGTDHSQVGRYLTAKNVKESRKGLLMNGLVKVPMQFFILLIGILIFSFYQYNKGPVYFDAVSLHEAKQTVKKDSLNMLEAQYDAAFAAKNMTEANAIRKTFKGVMQRALPEEKPNDTNFIFLWFVKENLPVGLIGLIFAIIFLAAWGSIAAALNSLAACSVVDFHKKFFVKKETELEDYKVAHWYTLGWGIFCIIISMFAYNIGNSLIEAVNILGSLFYGVILGIFLVALGMKFIRGHAVFYAAIISELLIIIIYKMDVVSFLWLNAIGAILVIVLASVLQLFTKQKALQ
ncbi:MAG: sodium:solute symporter [Chitinophagaceae bacterium]|nr:sodium:solute symporter [Chitinophagaceae bacterium]MBK8786820.1 sodium:solute symporter [Chitinophagaceae bacterium]MBK9486877.1 sodium:solute symporter [Chitinophagaceae bacterium]MBL0202562.1 sodium:solute symporter [Chitinophagaceae bacterium]